MFRYILSSILLSGFFVAGFGQEANQLSELEEMAGYDLLWNGQDFDGWHGYRLNRVTSVWEIKSDGNLGPRIETVAGGEKIPILTDTQYKNFDFKAEVASIYPDGNSGIFLRYREEAIEYWEKRSGPEVQICADQNSDCKNAIHSFGACYEMFPVTENLRTSWYNPPGEWNQLRVIVYDSNYVHYGNGKKLLEYKIGTQEFQRAYDASKYSTDGNNGNYYDIHEGSILLQHHSEVGMTFRNLKAKTLEIHPFLQEFPDGQWPDELPQDYVFGKRGCTNPEAINYDETAVVDDSTCETEVSIHDPNSWKNLEVVQWKSGSNEYMFELNFAHKKVAAYHVDGREIKLSKNGQIYLLNLDGNNLGLVILRVTVTNTEIIKPIKF